MAIPVELITMAVSAVWSGLLTYGSKRLDHQERLLQHTILKGEVQDKLTESARSMSGWQLTRRAIALMAVGAVIVVPMIAPFINPNIDVTIGWTEMAGGFWPFTDAKEVFVWKTVSGGGFVLTPLQTHMCSAITGFFFGNQVAK
jgi:hypothetical protein